MKFLTHSGRFHADETLAAAMLLLGAIADEVIYLEDVSWPSINQYRLTHDCIVGDIGREYIPSERLFDHHQGDILRPHGELYATAGLIWKHYGKDVIERVLFGDTPTLYDPRKVEFIWEKVDKRIVIAIDANDADSTYSFFGNIRTVFYVAAMDLPTVIRNLNCSDSKSEDHINNRSMATEMLKQLLKNSILAYAATYDARGYILGSEIVEDHILLLEKGVPWRSVVHELNESRERSIYYVIAPSDHPGNKYSLIAVTSTLGGRDSIKPIERLGGFKDFIHNNKFIAGSNSIEDLIKLGKLNLEEYKESLIF